MHTKLHVHLDEYDDISIHQNNVIVTDPETVAKERSDVVIDCEDLTTVARLVSRLLDASSGWLFPDDTGDLATLLELLSRSQDRIIDLIDGTVGAKRDADRRDAAKDAR